MNKRANIPWARIEARLVELDKDQAWLRTTLEVEPNVITNWKSRGAPASKAVSIALALGLSTDQLLGSPVDLSDVPGAMRVVVAEPGDPNFYQIKKVKLQLRAGVTGFQTVPDIYDGDTISLRKNWVDRKGIHPSTLLALTVAGDSMEPNLYEGDVVVIDTADKVMKDGAVYAFNYDGESVIKRLVKERGDWWLFSDNPDQARHRPKGCRSGDCGIIGRVVKRETDHI
ncbi:hypothetical protein GTP44_04000 [Duganella sp. FT50W]|uniref:Peptidase S24/S26A/S26B/S26C domain-containing protein n=1 Tax=Duganella lactea TaxID=2692173 RepID=A0A6L8MFY7_9BURK|nr:S24 family peptidase [Duganella lactea]MYM81121.1 hypothetical protein [Duganella lactea]